MIPRQECHHSARGLSRSCRYNVVNLFNEKLRLWIKITEIFEVRLRQIQRRVFLGPQIVEINRDYCSGQILSEAEEEARIAFKTTIDLIRNV